MKTALRQLAACAIVLGAAWSAGAEPAAPAPDFVDMPEDPAAAAAEKDRPPPPDEKPFPSYVPGYRREPSVGLSPLTPQLQAALPGALTPSYGAPVRGGAWRLSFRGYLQAAARASVGTRDGGAATLHGDPVVPGGAYGWFDHSGTVPDPWTELNFVYGNREVAATVSLAAWSLARVDEAGGSALPQAQLWLTNAFLTYSPDVGPARLKVNVGVFPDRYGFMGDNQQGPYGEVLIGAVQGMGTTATLELPFEGDLVLAGEAGFKGQFGKPPLGIPFDGSSDFARAQEGSTFAGHGHFAATWLDRYTLAAHAIHSWSQDDRKDGADALPDGSLGILGLDLRLKARRWGYFYVGVSRVTGEAANSVSSLVRVLNAGSGYELNQRFWGFESEGTGSLLLVGGQYTLSLGTLLRYPMEYSGEGPDLSVSVFGVHGTAQSAAVDRRMFKYGGEVLYGFCEHAAASVRLDHLMPDLGAPGRSFGVISPRLILRTGWLTRQSLTVQYSYYALGERTRVEGDRRLVNTTSQQPDRHLLAVHATTWW